jgi:hypothetical protein
MADGLLLEAAIAPVSVVIVESYCIDQSNFSDRSVICADVTVISKWRGAHNLYCSTLYVSFTNIQSVRLRTNPPCSHRDDSNRLA